MSLHSVSWPEQVLAGLDSQDEKVRLWSLDLLWDTVAGNRLVLYEGFMDAILDQLDALLEGVRMFANATGPWTSSRACMPEIIP